MVLVFFLFMVFMYILGIMEGLEYGRLNGLLIGVLLWWIFVILV